MSTVPAPMNRAQQQVVTIRDLLDKQKKQIALALPKHMTPERMLRIVMTSIQKTPKLLECTRESLLASIMQAAQLGLEPDGVLGRAYLIPRKKKGTWECQFQTGYKGLMDLAYRSGQVAYIAAEVVHAKDILEVNLGTERSLKHRPYEPTDEKDDAGPVRAFYAVSKLKDGSTHFYFMWKGDVDRVRDEYSDAADTNNQYAQYSPWNTNQLTYEEMGKKTVLRRLCKTLPASTEDVKLHAAIVAEERSEVGLPTDLGDVIDIPQAEVTDETTEQPAAPEKPSALDKIVNEAKAKPADDDDQPITEEQFRDTLALADEFKVKLADINKFLPTIGHKKLSEVSRKDHARVIDFIKAQK
jgi:recombination protein RecT